MGKRKRARGDVDGVCSVQFVPSHVHVSPKMSKPWPPNITICWCAWSYAIPISDLFGGDVAGDCWAHVAPSQVQVSLKMASVPPPNMTITWRAPSQTRPMFARAFGGEGTTILFHVRPFQTHVSFMYPLPLKPPNIRTCLLTGS